MVIKSIAEITVGEDRLAALIPLTEETTGITQQEFEVGSDLEFDLTPKLETELRRELSVDVGFLDHGLDDLGAETTVGVDAMDATSALSADPLMLRDAIATLSGGSDVGELDDFVTGLGGSSSSPIVLSAPDVMKVGAVEPTGTGSARLSVDKAGAHQFDVEIPLERAGEIMLGEPVIGSEELWRSDKPITVGRTHVEFEPARDQPPPLDIWLPLMRLHCPSHKGCKANYKRGESDDQSGEVKLEIAGMGGTIALEVMLEFDRDYTAESCLELVVPAKLLMLVGRTLVNGQEIASGTRAKVTGVERDNEEVREVPHETDGCGQPSGVTGALPKLSLDQTRAPAGEYWHAIKLKREVSGQVAVGLKIGGHIPINFGIDYKRVAATETTISTLLAPGAKYVAYAPKGGGAIEDHIEICWTAKGKRQRERRSKPKN